MHTTGCLHGFRSSLRRLLAKVTYTLDFSWLLAPSTQPYHDPNVPISPGLTYLRALSRWISGVCPPLPLPLYRPAGTDLIASSSSSRPDLHRSRQPMIVTYCSLGRRLKKNWEAAVSTHVFEPQRDLQPIISSGQLKMRRIMHLTQCQSSTE
jgi:hypothetical protein